MACIKSNDGEKTEVNSIFLPLGKTRGIVIIMSSSVVCLSTFPCEQHNSTKSYPILMKLHRIVPCCKRKNPIDFCNDDVINDVTVTSFLVKSPPELVNTITRPNLIRSWWNFTGLFLGGYGRTLLIFVIMTSSVTSFPVQSVLELVSTITQPFFIRSSPNLVGLMLYE